MTLHSSLKYGIIKSNLRETALGVPPPRAASNHERSELSMATHDYTPSDIQRFWSKVDTSGGMFACWIWTAAKNVDGYGYLKNKRKVWRAHRVSWELAHGHIPRDLYVLHVCDNPSCVNPIHLFLGTAQDNVDDMISKGRKVEATGDRHGSKTHPEQWAKRRR